MPGSKNSKNSPRSKDPASIRRAAFYTALCWIGSAAALAAAIAYFYKSGSTLYFGDAESHLDIARRIVDSRTPGWDQVGTTWLPLPHLLMIPLVRNDWMWRTGLGGAVVSGFAMSVAVAFLFALVHRITRSSAAAAASAAVFLLNPNTLYMGSIPMTESFFFAALCALAYCTVRFSVRQGWTPLLGASIAGFAGAWIRYEGWFLLPFAALFILLSGGRRRWSSVAVFCVIAGAAPLLWLLHNRYYFGDPLYFYRGPWSALAIQGKVAYPGKGDWTTAARYVFEAGRLIAGWPAILICGAGLVALLLRRNWWPVLLLALPAAFYVWSVHSSATPIFVPTLWPNSFYNIRYGMALLPVVAMGAGGVVMLMGRFEKWAVLLVAVALAMPLIGLPITLQEAEINSRARRQWIAATASYLQAAAGSHESYFTSFGDLTAVYRTLGVPLRDTLTGDNGVEWDAAVVRPDFFLYTDWAVAMSGDAVQTVVDKARLHGPRYELEKRFTFKGAPAIEIYKRIDENPVH